MRIDGVEFGVFEDEIIIELDGDDFIESVALEDDIASFAVVEDVRSDIGDVDLRCGVFECDLGIDRDNLPIFEYEEYEVFTTREDVSIQLDIERTLC